VHRSYDRHAQRRRLIGAGVSAILLSGAAGVYLASAKDPAPQGTNHAAFPSRAQVAESAPTSVPATEALRPIEATGDPETFAVREVAHAVFDWDTTQAAPLSDYTGRLLAVADPTGEESPGLVADLTHYLPSPATWAGLRQYQTRQWIDIGSVRVPDRWPSAIVEAGPEGLRPGTTAYTIGGVRHRAGIWEGHPVATSHHVTFTVFLLCRPSYATCHLLRLSMLDQPLG